ncbi:thiol:disulfide interchange protein TlpA [Methylobacterium planeticum]|uniref:TlpA family protein disulfide reductase n=1 Tax=Methylobacterium planeticum TaxID=2615211 RepID=A0A6N6MSN0_9HYPH|nr:TlpA disulfide reductase family protein [Methylobacterium planeticum]KAB1073393.1 TlpA family protein disulfide reductase [Methylobacterium planeticum]
MPGRLTSFVYGAALIAALGAGLALYGTGSTGGNGNTRAEPCAGSEATRARLAPLARGEVAAMQVLDAAKPAPALSFKDAQGAEVSLADLRGRTLLVNLWATWCAPCKAEMPALDRLQGALGGADFAVVAINVDTRNLDKPLAWLKENGIARLAYYADPGGRVLPAIQRDTGSTGLPTTLLIDPKGCEIGVMKGPAEWSSGDAERLIRAALGPAS